MEAYIMSIYESKTYISDLKEVVLNTPIVKDLQGKSVLITGAGGLICSGIVDLLLMCNEMFSTNITIYAADYNVEGTTKRFESYPDKNVLTTLKIIYYDATKKNQFSFKSDYIIHGASNAHPKAIAEKPVETMLDNFSGMYDLLEYARKSKVLNIVFISSSEVYGLKETQTPFKENEYGYLDILNPRNSYSSSKRAGETLCVSYSAEYGVHTNIVRPGHIYGPTASPKDSRVGSSFAYDAVNGKNIVLKSKGEQIRSYCYMLDCDSAILTVLLKGECSNAYNISNSKSIVTIKELAEMYADAGGVKVVFDMPSMVEKAAFNPMSNSSLDSKKLEKLGWEGRFDAKRGTLHTLLALLGK